MITNETTRKLVFNFLIEGRRKEVNEFERATMLKEYMRHYKMSVRAASEELGIPVGTLQGWLSWDKISPQEYEVVRAKGCSKSDVIRAIKKQGFDAREMVVKHPFELALEDCIFRMRPFLKDVPSSENANVKALCQELRDVCSRLLMRMD